MVISPPTAVHFPPSVVGIVSVEVRDAGYLLMWVRTRGGISSGGFDDWSALLADPDVPEFIGHRWRWHIAPQRWQEEA